jgi:hypothetical protein
MRRTAFIAGLVLLAAVVVLDAATVYLGLRPGVSRREDVDRALGQPVSTISPTAVEYLPQQGTGKILVTYRGDEPVVENIEVFFTAPIERAALLQAMSLSGQPQTRTDEGGALIEFYGEPHSIALTYQGASQSTGIRSVGYYAAETLTTTTEIAKRYLPPAPILGATDAELTPPVALDSDGFLSRRLAGYPMSTWIAVVVVGLIVWLAWPKTAWPKKRTR